MAFHQMSSLIFSEKFIKIKMLSAVDVISALNVKLQIYTRLKNYTYIMVTPLHPTFI